MLRKKQYCKQQQKCRIKKKAIDTSDTRLANDLSIFCTSQINAAQLAETKALTSKVKAFAEQMKEQYMQLNKNLNRIAESYQVRLPAALSVTSENNFKDLKRVKGASFDHAYLLQMLKDHNGMIRRINAAKNIQCFPIKLFVISNQAAIIKTAYVLSDLKDQTP